MEIDGLELVQVFVIQDSRSGNFLTRECGMTQSLKRAGRLYDKQEAVDTARAQFGGEYEIHSFYEHD